MNNTIKYLLKIILAPVVIIVAWMCYIIEMIAKAVKVKLSKIYMDEHKNNK